MTACWFNATVCFEVDEDTGGVGRGDWYFSGEEDHCVGWTRRHQNPLVSFSQPVRYSFMKLILLSIQFGTNKLIQNCLETKAKTINSKDKSESASTTDFNDWLFEETLKTTTHHCHSARRVPGTRNSPAEHLKGSSCQSSARATKYWYSFMSILTCNPWPNIQIFKPVNLWNL